jgi:hypothetical protein
MEKHDKMAYPTIDPMSTLTTYPAMKRKVIEQTKTIKILVNLVDELRQSCNHSSRHDLYEKAVNTLSTLEDEGKI